VLLEGGHEDLMVTLKLEVAYRRPTPTAMPLTVVGYLRRRTSKRAEAEAELRLPDGTVSASATVLLVRPPESITSRWAAELPYWKVDEDAEPAADS
jgi:acyl-CoA thioesterase FadM